MKVEREPCPQKVVDRANILYHNGVTGFQGPHGGGKDLFVLCLFNTNWNETASFEKNILPKIRVECESPSLEVGDWIGRDYLSIHWSEYKNRFRVLSKLLQHNISFQTETKGLPPFGGKRDVGVMEFTRELLEKRVIEQCQELIKLNPGLMSFISFGCYYEWNWETEEGKKFAVELREKFGDLYESAYQEDATNFYEWDLFQEPYDPLTLCDLSTTTTTKNITLEKENEECMICFDQEATVMVLPCEHCVVCKDCSLALVNTNNNLLCIKCRQVITHKLI